MVKNLQHNGKDFDDARASASSTDGKEAIYSRNIGERPLQVAVVTEERRVTYYSSV